MTHNVYLIRCCRKLDIVLNRSREEPDPAVERSRFLGRFLSFCSLQAPWYRLVSLGSWLFLPFEAMNPPLCFSRELDENEAQIFKFLQTIGTG